MTGRKLAANVSVGGVDYHAGDTVPAEVAKEITNPKAWAKDEKSSDKSSDSSDKK